MIRRTPVIVMAALVWLAVQVSAEDLTPKLRKEVAAWAAQVGRAGYPPEPPTDFVKLMPLKQSDLVERLGAAVKLRQQAVKESNGLKRKEATEKADQIEKEATEDLERCLATDGIKDWVFVYGIYNDSDQGIRVVASGRISAIVSFDKMGDGPKKAIRGLKAGDIIKVTASANPTAKGAVGIRTFEVPGTTVVSVENVK